MKLLSQDKKKIFEFEGCSLFVEDNIILISKSVNIYDGKPNILGEYNDEEECKSILLDILYNNLYNTYYKMPEAGKRFLNGKEVKDEGK